MSDAGLTAGLQIVERIGLIGCFALRGLAHNLDDPSHNIAPVAAGRRRSGAPHRGGRRPENTGRKQELAPIPGGLSGRRCPRGTGRKQERAPVVPVFSVDLSVVAAVDQELDRIGLAGGASVYPLVWNVLLAARVGATRLMDNALIEPDGESFRVTL